MYGLRSIPSRLLQFAFVAFCVSPTVSAQTPTGDVVITTNTSWPTATYSLTSLTVQNGATLTVGGGSTVNVSGAITVTANSAIVAQSINNTAKINGAWQGVGVTFSASTAQVDAGSSINADSQGYVAGAGPGTPVSGYSGSYGGAAGDEAATIAYGSASAPVDLGSGSYLGYGVANGQGGGAIRLQISGTLTNNGTISASGYSVTAVQGSGAGGSVYVTAGSLAGSGSFTANGGSNSSAASAYNDSASGGRVAVYYTSASGFTGFLTSTAAGGACPSCSTGKKGSDGTSVFVDTSGANPTLVLDHSYSIPANSTLLFNSILVQNGATLTIGGGSVINVSGAITVAGNSTIVAQSINNTAQVNGSWQGVGVTLTAASVSIDAGSSLNADGQGYVTNAGPGDGPSAGGGSGGSFGGAGGYNPGPTYGSAAMPTDLGSGGLAAQYSGSNGGGAIHLTVRGTLALNGTISSNGEMVEPARGGAGAGGSIYVTTAVLTGSGTFSANGGSNTTPTLSGSAAGGGGRVAVYSSSATAFTGFVTSTASGGIYTGTAAGYAGAVGTIAFFDTSATNTNIAVYQAYAIPANSSVSYNNFTISNGATLLIGGGANITLAGAATITGNSRVFVGSVNNTAQVNAAWQGAGATISAASLQLDAGSSISADNQGYVANIGPGAGIYVGGASYGGLGSSGSSGGSDDFGPVYGSATAPVDLGSGGGSGQNTGGGQGGGAIHFMISGTFTNDGSISANGGSLTASGYGGAGAGGSVYVQAATIAGSGNISANGGSNNTPPAPAGGGGGGGRVSVVFTNNQGFSKSSISVTGGTGGGLNASAGTINFNQGAALTFIQPLAPAVHGSITVQWFNGTGNPVTLSVAGPRSSTLYTGTATSFTWDTTQVPAGAYELRLTTADSTGTTLQAFKNIVVNNSVLWFSGTLAANTHWTANNVYVLDADLIIPSGLTLLVDPGTVVKALPGVKIVVQSGGTLSAAGTSSAPVTFTTFDDFTAGGNTDFNQGITLPSPGEWGGIQVLSGGTFISNAYTIIRYLQSTLTGTLGTSTTLLPTQVYEISGTLSVPTGVTLTILPGSIVKFDGAAGIYAQTGSTIIANGTSAQPIYLTSINDSSMGGTSTAAPKAGDWNTIFLDGANASFQFVQMLYGGGPVSTNTGQMLQTGHGAIVTIDKSTLAYSYNIALGTGFDGAGDTVTVTNTVFHDDQERAVNVSGGSTVHIVNDTFDSNLAGIENLGGVVDVANSVISNFSSAMYGGIGGSAFNSLVNNDVYTTITGTQNYFSIPDPTGTNGNISANPVYMNGAQRDYRPTYGSPLIDAANGTVAGYSTTDAFNDPRFNSPLVTTKTGTPDANGKYPDIGAFEFVQTAPSDLDLTVTNVQGPSAAVVGTQAQITWTVTNIGTGTAYGPWHDSVYLVTDPSTNPQAVLAGTFLEGSGVVLGPGGTSKATAIVNVPGTTVGPHVWQVRTNVRGEVFEGANTANNTASSLGLVSVDLPQLIVGGSAVSGSFPAGMQSAYYKVIPAASQAVQISLAATASGNVAVQLFVGAGYVPTPQRYDYASTQFDSASPSVFIPAGSNQTFYITAYLQSVSAVAAPFTLAASPVQFSLISVSPSTVVNGGVQTLTFTGGGFTANTVFSIVSSAGTTYAPKSVFLSDSDHANLSFDLTSVPAGTYSAKAVEGASTAQLSRAVTITDPSAPTQPAGVSSSVQISLETPTTLRLGFPSTVTLHYTNTGNTDIPAPLIYVNSNTALSEVPPACTGCNTAYPQQYANTYASGTVLGINNQGPAGILPAGASGSISFLAEATGRTGSATFSATANFPDPIATQLVSVTCVPGACYEIDKFGSYPRATDFCASLVPAGASPVAFNRACMLLLNSAGYTYTSSPGLLINLPPSAYGKFYFAHLSAQGFNGLLATDATNLAAAGTPEYDLQRLLAFELQKDGLPQFLVRYHQGAFGYGRSHDFDITATGTGGAFTVLYPDGNARVFSTASTTQINTYLGAVGDYGVLTINSDGSLTVSESNGSSIHLAASGATYQLDSLSDRDGNKTNVSYTNGLVSGVSDAFGNSLSFQYDSFNHIVQTTDSAGRVTTYTYDANAYLTGIKDSTGTTAITWNESVNPAYINDTCIATYCEPAIGVSSITYPDGTHTYFSYDAAGRLISQKADGNLQPVSITYNADGSTTRTDALGKSITVALSDGGEPLAITDPLGSVTRFRYDGEGKPTNIVGALGDSHPVNFDSLGNISALQSGDGSFSSFLFSPDQSLASFTDPSGNTTSFGYNANYDLLTQTDPGSQPITRTYSAQGQVLTRTNRRGNTETFTYDMQGYLLTKTYSNNVQFTYTYDTHGNLLTATTPTGTTSYTYDAADHCTSIVNPDGTSLAYSYNSFNQRTQMKDRSGFVTNYTYDAAGRLSALTDASGKTTVAYTYDATGRPATKTLGNGTSAANTYDAAGHVTSVVNYSAAHAVLSEFDYTYDAEGRPVTATSPAGASTYTYDLDSQLTGATTPTASLQYTYGPSGNRTQAVTNGVSVPFLADNLNQYTTVGPNSYQYDADGNLIAGNGYTYTYDDENHLLSMANASDTWSFQYDALGNRTVSIHNGVATHFLIDPAGFGNVEGEFTAAGQPVTHYIYGLDLISAIPASGAASYFHYDASGNTAQLTDAAGAIVNSYTYLPFGEETVLASRVANPYTYGGAYGVRDEGAGAYFMRRRWYSPAQGRFLERDPLGLSGGLNQYEFAGNSPVSFGDPSGLSLFPTEGQDNSEKYDYFTFSVSTPIGTYGPQINLHNGEVFLSAGTPGTGINVGFGHLINAPADRGAATSNFLSGLSSSLGYTIGGGANVVTALDGSFQQSVESVIGFGGKGAGINYAASADLEPVQDTFTVLNYYSGGRLFGTDPSTPIVFAHPKPSVCGSCLTTPGHNQGVPVTSSLDPNGKITSGFGNNGYVPVNVPITYTVYFENQPTATAAAVKVSVTDQLAINLDWSTLQLNSIAFNDATLNIPGGPQTYSAQANVSTDRNPVNVAAALDPATGLLTVTMQSVDPVTGSLPTDPTAGFLPPNNAANAGVGSVTFTITPKQGLPNATQITNQASIVFDVNAAIATNTVTNTLDLTAPFSSVNPLPPTITSTSIPVSWSSSDPSGSGIASYDIYVSTDGAAYSLWLSATTASSATYTGALVGHTYAFYSLATNNVGTTQTATGTPQLTSVQGQQPTVTVNPAFSTITATQSLSVSITVAGSGAPTPTGSIVLSSGSYASSAIALASGAATVVIPAGALAASIDTLLATYTPDSIGAQTYASASGSAGVTVTSPSVQVTVGTSPAGEAFSVDGISYTTSQSFTWAAGSTHTLATTSPQTSAGTQASFTSWSDAGTISHTVTATSSTANYTASFSLAYLLSTQAAPSAGGSITPASGTYYAAGTVVPLAATPAAGYNFLNWTGNVASPSSASTTVTLSSPQTVTANFALLSVPQASLTPASLSFASPTGVASAAQTVTLTNTGTGPLSLSSITLTGANASAFGQTSTCGSTVAVGASCAVSVTFTPTSSGSYSGSLTVNDNAANSPQTVTINGSGTAAPTFSLSAAPQQQTITLSQTATYTITVTPNGGPVTSSVALTASGLPSGATAIFTPSTVTPGATAVTSTLSIRFPSGHAENSPVRHFPINAPIFAAVSLAVLAIRRRRRLLNLALLAALSVITIAGMSGCGGTGPVNYTVTVTGSGGNGQTASTTVVLTTQ